MKSLLLSFCLLFPLTAKAACFEAPRQVAVFLSGTPDIGPATNAVFFDGLKVAEVICPEGEPSDSYVDIPAQKICDEGEIKGHIEKNEFKCRILIIYTLKAF